MKRLMKLAAAAALGSAAMLAACTDKYDDSAIRRDISELTYRVATLEDAVTALDERLDAGALIKSVTPITGYPGGWRVEFTGGTPSIDIPNGVGVQGQQGVQGAQGERGPQGEQGETGATGPQGIPGTTPLIEVRRGDYNTATIWYSIDRGTTWTDTGTNIKGAQGERGPQGEQGETGPTGPQGQQGEQGETGPQGEQGIQGPAGAAGISPRVRVKENGDGTVTIQYNITATYPDANWVDAGTPIALDSNPDDKAAIFSIVDNAARGTVTITMNDGDTSAQRTAYTFAKASGAVRIELTGFTDRIDIDEGETGKISFRVNPSNAWVPTGAGAAIAGKWMLDQTGTRAATWVTVPTDFRLAGVAPDAGKPGQYVATIECTGADPSISRYAMALVLDTGAGTADSPALVSSPVFAVGAPNISDTTGGLKWVLSDGTLTIDGTGPMPNYTAPWSEYAAKDIEVVLIGDGVTSIGNDAFSGCAVLTSVIIGNGVETIGERAFKDCANLRNVEIGDGVKTIGNDAFYHCDALTSIEIPGGVTSIGNYALYNCSNLRSVEIGDGVKTIGNYAFNGCSALTGIVIPATVTSIGNYAFYNCDDLTSIICLATTPPTLLGTSYIIDSPMSGVLRVPAGSMQDYKNISKWYLWRDTTYEEIP